MIAATVNRPSSCLADTPRVSLIDTRLGPVECAISGDGPPVLCLHGAMGGFDQGLLLARVLGESGYRYLAPSRPGYLGTPLERGVTPEAQADLYAALLDACGADRAAVLAVSGGGPSAIHFALRHPRRCAALVLVSTCAGPVDNRLPLSFTVMQLLAHLPFVASAIQRKTVERPEEAARRAVTNPVHFERLLRDADAWPLLQALQSSTMDRMTSRFAGTKNDVEATRSCTYPLEDIRVPTLIVQGTADPYVAIARHGTVFAQRVPDAELLALAGGEHAAIFTHRDEARSRVTLFLRQHHPGGGEQSPSPSPSPAGPPTTAS